MAEITLILDAKKRISLSKLLKFNEVSSVTASILEKDPEKKLLINQFSNAWATWKQI